MTTKLLIEWLGGWGCYELIRGIQGEEGVNDSVLGIFENPAKILPPA